LVLEDKGLRNDGTDAARTEQAGQGNKEMDKQNDQIAHRRIVAGREILRKYGQTTIRQPQAQLPILAMHNWNCLRDVGTEGCPALRFNLGQRWPYDQYFGPPHLE
jgi:hypothetical protein